MKKELTLQELQPMILEWANNKWLLKKENAPKQHLKLIEECGELASAILKNDVELQKDALGDIFVVLIILSEQLNLEVRFDFLDKESEGINIWVYMSNIIRYGGYIKQNVSMLNGLSIELNLDLTECANLAWNEIKDRTGKTVDGTFIKD